MWQSSIKYLYQDKLVFTIEANTILVEREIKTAWKKLEANLISAACEALWPNGENKWENSKQIKTNTGNQRLHKN